MEGISCDVSHPRTGSAESFRSLSLSCSRLRAFCRDLVERPAVELFSARALSCQAHADSARRCRCKSAGCVVRGKKEGQSNLVECRCALNLFTSLRALEELRHGYRPGLRETAPINPSRPVVSSYHRSIDRAHDVVQSLTERLREETHVFDAGLGSAVFGAAFACARSQPGTPVFLRGKTIMDAGAVELGQILRRRYCNVFSLDLRDNAITDYGVRHLAEALRHNSTLGEIDLRGNSIGSDGVAVLASALRDNHAITLCDVRDQTKSPSLAGNDKIGWFVSRNIMNRAEFLRAAGAGDIKSVAELLELGVSPLAADPATLMTAAHLAVTGMTANHVEVLRRLAMESCFSVLCRTRNFERVGGQGSTPFDLAHRALRQRLGSRDATTRSLQRMSQLLDIRLRLARRAAIVFAWLDSSRRIFTQIFNLGCLPEDIVRDVCNACGASGDL